MTIRRRRRPTDLAAATVVIAAVIVVVIGSESATPTAAFAPSSSTATSSLTKSYNTGHGKKLVGTTTAKSSQWANDGYLRRLLSSPPPRPLDTRLFVQSEVLVEASGNEEQQQQQLIEIVKEEQEEGEEQQQQLVEEETQSQRLEGPLTEGEINARLERQLQKMRLKDQTSKQLTKEELVIVHEDANMVVVDKPSGVLTVAGKDPSNPSLAQAVFDNINGVADDVRSADHMVVHRLGMDTSGLIMLAKNRDAVRTLNGVFRERKVDRRYEALVAGHMKRDHGLICLPVMRDYQCPPFVRISTEEHQRALVDLDPEVVGKKILEGPKESITKYEVVEREFLQGQPVTRVVLTSISGRYHQLNVHLAAFGHPIVGDTVYGINGEAPANGGLTNEELERLAPNPNRASLETQHALAKIAADSKMPPCTHAKFIKFTHPYTKKVHEFTTKSPF